MSETPGIYQTSVEKRPALSVEERLTVAECMIEAMIAGPYAQDPVYLRQIAVDLNSRILIAEQYQTLSPAVIAELKRHADELVQIDKYQDAIKPSLRPL